MSYGFADVPLPITILTGFLGAGKTTLLNRMLTGDHGRRIAVIQNEFGALSIDHDLILSVEENITTLANGCICCTVQDNMVEALEELIGRREAFDQIIIETSGLADPSSLLMTLLQHPGAGESFLLSGVVTLVDAGNIERQLAGEPEAMGQIACADRIILNKADTVEGEALSSITEHLREINPVAPVESTTFAETDVIALMELGGFDLQRFTLPETPHPHRHHDDISSVSLSSDRGIDLGRFEEWMVRLIEEEHEKLYRIKGILDLSDQPRQYIFQGVHLLSNWEYGRAWGDRPRWSRLVIIGRALDEAGLRESFSRCLQ